QVVKSRDAKKVFTIRTASFDAAGIGGNAPVTEAARAGTRPGARNRGTDQRPPSSVPKYP
ncbi:electron transfer flavoprotein subunit alpha/FixB family protein, partial [Paracoccus sp. APAP_BH8]